MSDLTPRDIVNWIDAESEGISQFQEKIHESELALNDYIFHAQEFLNSRSKLFKSLQELYSDPLNITGILGSHIESFLNLSQIQNEKNEHQDSLKFVSCLKKALKESKNNYKKSFENINGIISYHEKLDQKQDIDERIIEDISSFKERRFDNFEKTVLEIMRTESKLNNLHIPHEQLLHIIDDAQEMINARDNSPYPKININIKSVLKSPIAIEYFKAFAKRELFSENLQFWLEVDLFKKIDNEDDLIKRAQRLHDRYIDDKGDRQINIDVMQRQSIERDLVNPNHEMFNSCQESVYELLNDSIPRFLESDFCLRMKQRLRSVRSVGEYAKYSGKRKTISVVNDIEQLNSIQTKKNKKISLKLHSMINLISPVTCIIEIDKKIWTGCGDGTILVWSFDNETNSFNEESRIVELKSNYPITTFVHFINQLLCLDSGGHVHILDIQKQKVKGMLGKAELIRNISKIDNNIWATTDNSIQEYAYHEKKKKWQLKTTKVVSYPITCLVKINNHIWTGDVRGNITKYNKTMNISEKVKVGSEEILSLFKSENFTNKKGFQSQNCTVWVVCIGAGLYVARVDDDKSIKKIENCHDLPIIASSRIDKYIIFASEDCTISLWDSETLEFSERLPNLHKDAIQSVLVSADERFIFCGSNDKSMSILEKISQPK